MIPQLGAATMPLEPAPCAMGWHRWTVWTIPALGHYRVKSSGETIKVAYQHRMCVRCNRKETRIVGV